MRGLKFRAWDKLDKEFVQNIDCLLDMSVAERVFALDDEGGELVIEQYTGLKDKNGKEIYEGDIVKCGPYSARPIVFEEGRYWLGEEPDDLFFSSGFFHGGIEVIGNIHENPELLEEEE